MRAALSAFAVASLLATAPAPAAPDPARAAAETFGRALVDGRAEALRPILPSRGKVRLTLTRFGPEDGAFAPQQVEALFRSFLATGKVTSFVVSRCESDGHGSGLAHARAALVDRDGRGGKVGVHLGFEPEGERWVLREVKETPE